MSTHVFGGAAGDFFDVEDRGSMLVSTASRILLVGGNRSETITQQGSTSLHSDFGAKRLRITGREPPVST